MKMPIEPRQWARKISDWFEGNARRLPWRQETDPYRIWLSEVMLQQTQVVTVIPYYENFLKKYPRLEDLAAADETAVLELWSGLGYYRRARSLHQAARLIQERHQGRIPEDYRQLLELPGVGRYSAGAILSIAFGQAFPVLDGNVRRVMLRYLGFRPPPPDRRLWDLLTETVALPEVAARISAFNQGLMELGATICTARNPACGDCPLQDECRARAADLQHQIGAGNRRPQPVIEPYTVAVVVSPSGLGLMKLNPEDGSLRGFWEFPKVPGSHEAGTLREVMGDLGSRLSVERELPLVRHQITFRKLRFRPYLCRLEAGPVPGGFCWVTPGSAGFPISAYTRKLWSLLEPADRLEKQTAR